MKYIIWGLLLVSIVYGGWPYAYAYRIDKALTESDRAVLNRLVDLDAIRSEIKRNIERDMDTALGADSDGVLGWLKSKVSEIGERAIDESIDLAWVSRVLTANGSFRQQTTHAFFESWNEFVIRLGELDQEPVHVRMTLTSGNWRITAIYE